MTDFPRPMVTTDAVIFGLVDDELSTLLIRRRHDPYAGCWAFPGGFVDEYEPVEDAIRREVEEESGVQLPRVEIVNAYGQRGRDPRGWTITVTYCTLVDASRLAAMAGDDAEDARWWTVANGPKMAFDHAQMLNDSLRCLRERIYTTGMIAPILGQREIQVEELERVFRQLDPQAPDPDRLVAILEINGVIARTSRSSLRLHSRWNA